MRLLLLPPPPPPLGGADEGGGGGGGGGGLQTGEQEGGEEGVCGAPNGSAAAAGCRARQSLEYWRDTGDASGYYGILLLEFGFTYLLEASCSTCLQQFGFTS